MSNSGDDAMASTEHHGNAVSDEQRILIQAWAECRADLEIGEFHAPMERRLARIEELVAQRCAELAQEPAGAQVDDAAFQPR